MKELTVVIRPVTSRPITVKTLRTIAEQALEARSVSAEVRRYHYRCLETFFWFIKNDGFTRNVFRRYKRFLAGKNLAPNTKNQYLSSARIFLHELMYEGILNTDITLNTHGFNENKRHKKDGLNKRELELLTAKLKSLTLTPVNNRLKAIIALMLFQGLRAKEIVGLKTKDIDFVNRRAVILGKQRDDKELIDLHPKTIQAIKAHLTTRHLSCRRNPKALVNSKNSYLFSGHKNYAGEKDRGIRRERLGEIIHDFFRELGIKKEPRAFRHNFVIAVLGQFKDLRKVQHFSRHRTLDMLMVYDDRMKQITDLPVYYKAFKNIRF